MNAPNGILDVFPNAAVYEPNGIHACNGIFYAIPALETLTADRTDITVDRTDIQADQTIN